MICKLCGYDDKKPLGVYVEDLNINDKYVNIALNGNGYVNIKLNDNGLKGMYCPKKHLANKMIIKDDLE